MKQRKTKKTNVIDKKWNSLSSLKDYFAREGDETVESFNGIELTTKEHTYTLLDSKLHREKK